MENMVKKNERAAETDLIQIERAVALHALDVTAKLVSQNKTPVNEIPGLVDAIAKAFMSSNTISGAMASLHSTTSVVVAAKPKKAVAQGPKRGRGRPKKITLTPPAETVEVIAKTETVQEQAVKRGRGRPKKIVAAVEQTATTPVEQPVETVAQEPEVTNVVQLVTAQEQAVKRGRGRPKKVKVEALRYTRADDPAEQLAIDAAFLSTYPAQATAKDSLVDTGDGKMTCLIDGKRVSFLKKYVETRYGMSLGDYKRVYNLPADYPATPPKFHKAKRKGALAIGLGRKKTEQVTEAEAPTPKATPRKRNSHRVDVAETVAA